MAENGEGCGYRREVLDARDREVRREIQLVAERLNRLDELVCGNGKPPLQERIMALVVPMIERVERHATKNMQEGDIMVARELERETKERKDQHRENRKLLYGLLVGIISTQATLVIMLIVELVKK